MCMYISNCIQNYYFCIFSHIFFLSCQFVSVGSMRELDVIDVARQDDITMRMREWTEYYENQRPRDKILNVISLEFSGTE